MDYPNGFHQQFDLLEMPGVIKINNLKKKESSYLDRSEERRVGKECRL